MSRFRLNIDKHKAHTHPYKGVMAVGQRVCVCVCVAAGQYPNKQRQATAARNFHIFSLSGALTQKLTLAMIMWGGVGTDTHARAHTRTCTHRVVFHGY